MTRSRVQGDLAQRPDGHRWVFGATRQQCLGSCAGVTAPRRLWKPRNKCNEQQMKMLIVVLLFQDFHFSFHLGKSGMNICETTNYFDVFAVSWVSRLDDRHDLSSHDSGYYMRLQISRNWLLYAFLVHRDFVRWGSFSSCQIHPLEGKVCQTKIRRCKVMISSKLWNTKEQPMRCWFANFGA